MFCSTNQLKKSKRWSSHIKYLLGTQKGTRVRQTGPIIRNQFVNLLLWIFDTYLGEQKFCMEFVYWFDVGKHLWQYFLRKHIGEPIFLIHSEMKNLKKRDKIVLHFLSNRSHTKNELGFSEPIVSWRRVFLSKILWCFSQLQTFAQNILR